jgi:hypothetical protein
VVEGAIRYGRFLAAIGKADTEFVMQGVTFLGPDAPWRDPWDIPLTVHRGGQVDTSAMNAVDGWYGPGLEEATRPDGYRPPRFA